MAQHTVSHLGTAVIGITRTAKLDAQLIQQQQQQQQQQEQLRKQQQQVMIINELNSTLTVTDRLPSTAGSCQNVLLIHQRPFM